MLKDPVKILKVGLKVYLVLINSVFIQLTWNPTCKLFMKYFINIKEKECGLKLHTTTEILKWISLITLTLIFLRLLTLRYGVINAHKKKLLQKSGYLLMNNSIKDFLFLYTDNWRIFSLFPYNVYFLKMYLKTCCGSNSIMFSSGQVYLITSYQLISIYHASPRAVLRYSKEEASQPQVLTQEAIV